jgi:hypothetical protein
MSFLLFHATPANMMFGILQTVMAKSVSRMSTVSDLRKHVAFSNSLFSTCACTPDQLFVSPTVQHLKV